MVTVGETEGKTVEGDPCLSRSRKNVFCASPNNVKKCYSQIIYDYCGGGT